eukprot:8914426-Pyramimonas_sp.AAC.1
MPRVPRHRVPEEANRLQMDTLQTAAAARCFHSPLYTEDHSRYSREVAELLQKRRGIIGNCACMSDDQSLRERQLSLELRRISRWLRLRKEQSWEQ